MARRRLIDSIPSRAAAWSQRLAVFALVVAALSVIVIRSELLEIIPSLATFGAALALAALAILLGVIGLVGIWRHGQMGLGKALTGILLGAALMPYPAYLGYRAYTRPALPDVATDLADPPRYDIIARLRGPGSNDLPLVQAARQRDAYPDLATLDLGSTPTVAYEAALAVVAKRKWRVVDAQPPIPGRRDGIIEAVSRSAVMGFRDYVVIRIRGSGKATHIDVRSAARYPLLDFGGENATRVRLLLDDIDEATGLIQARLDKDAERNAEKAARPARQPAQRTRR
ncbi:MAG TPA: DUF1499 domain-containing protein [Pseudolabrys sp.]|nr:DUF1499 domain-containing protein [Pseudolabrys sp.]